MLYCWNSLTPMQRYIEQLIEDLDALAANPPPTTYYEVPPFLDELPHAAELALVPFRTIEEWTGINQNAFPCILDLETDEWVAVSQAILRLFEAMNIALVDAPENLPSDMLYDALTLNWDMEIQYLPAAGFDLELCTRDPDTCPYGEFCDCQDEWEEDADAPNDVQQKDDLTELPF